MSTELTSPTPGGVSVGSLRQAWRRKREFDAVLTLEDPAAHCRDRLRFNHQPHPLHLVLRFEDVDSDQLGLACATSNQVEQVLEFGRRTSEGSLLVHCLHGVGRSAACAMAVIADRLGAGREDQAVSCLFGVRPMARPNLVVVHLADQLLGRRGALVASLVAWEARDPVFQAARRARMDFVHQNLHLYSIAL